VHVQLVRMPVCGLCMSHAAGRRTRPSHQMHDSSAEHGSLGAWQPGGRQHDGGPTRARARGREVDTMLRAFQDINADMERTGELVAAMAKGELLKMVARNNVMRTGILSSKIGLTKRFDAAWRDAECSRIYEHLREEMEIERRYEDLEVKVRGRRGGAPRPACPWPIGAGRRDSAARGSDGGHVAAASLNIGILCSTCAALLAGGGCDIPILHVGLQSGQAGSARQVACSACKAFMQGEPEVCPECRSFVRRGAACRQFWCRRAPAWACRAHAAHALADTERVWVARAV